MFQKKRMKFEIHKKNHNISIPTVAGNSEASASDETRTNERCYLGQRHVVIFIGFLNCFLINTNRLVLGVSIVAMVKHGQMNETSKRNISEISCPLPSVPSKPVVGSNFQGEFDWNTEMQGYVLGAGFLGFLITQAPAGRLADAVGCKSMIVFSNALTGLLVFISPFAARWNIYALMAVQFLRGASQGITTPAIFKMLSNWIPRTERGTLNSLAMCGYSVGLAFGGLVTGWLCDIPGFGWPSAFYVWGTFCFMIAIAIQFTYYEHPMNNPWITEEELKYITDGLEIKVSEKVLATPWKKIFTSIPCYAYCYGLFGHYWGIGYFLTSHPTFMGTVLHYSMAENGLASCLPVLITTVSGVLSSMLSHWVSKKNLISLNMLRKTATAVSAFGYSLCMAGILLAGCDSVINVLCFALSLFFKGIGLAGIVISGVDMAPAFAGSVMGVSTNVASLASLLVPVATGLLTTHETLSEWQNVFWLNLVIVGSSGLVYLLFGSAEVQTWNYPDDEHPNVATNEGRRRADKNLDQSIEIKENLEMQNT
ncbi:Putative inorganic phosphate cotransporter [Araneus ventricosus]|uniref:Inorganic phosphate cotransporter n=1 Tax=Araneus ventricosus TaxID=182803 RepID=A0A4Y2INA1_ARAVE|nr:Putative inorganic phosphate cotransporter [Araneus ventricosus]